jgi:hypothetical protein
MKHRTEGHTETTISGDTRADWSEAFELAPSLQIAYVWHASIFTREVLNGPRQRLRIVVSRMDREASLETSTCRRTLTATGSITEVVRLNGNRSCLTDQQLERFINSFPVETV